MIEYQIIKGFKNTVEELVIAALSQGWQLQGGITISYQQAGGHQWDYAQALTRGTVDPKKEKDDQSDKQIPSATEAAIKATLERSITSDR